MARRTSTASRGPHSNRLDIIPEPKRSRVMEFCRVATLSRGANWTPCVERNHACYRCQDLADGYTHPKESNDAG